ncbi:MAG: hypothetical protein QGI13_16440 [Rhodospirillales bacterium]|nr:hypothetical protein [Rhodospirillales bacterium]
MASFRFLRSVLLGLVVLAIAACQTPPPVQRLPTLTYGHLDRLHLDAAAIEVISEFTSPMKAPNVEHLFPTPPQTALERWAADRLEAAGRRGIARFIIKDARGTATALAIDKGLAGAFKKEQSVRYAANIEVLLEIVDERGFRKGFSSARVSRTRTLAEDATLNERDKAWFELTEALMNDFNTEMEKNVRQYLGGFLF